jgi:uncharacterized protein YjbJ (UPF0337 family)
MKGDVVFETFRCSIFTTTISPCCLERAHAGLNSLAPAVPIQRISIPWRLVWNVKAVVSVDNPAAFNTLETIIVDKDRIRGSAEQAKGKVKEVVGKVTGDSKLESEGKADQFKGKVQNAVGGLKDTLRGK